MDKDRPQQRPRSPGLSGSNPILRPTSGIQRAATGSSIGAASTPSVPQGRKRRPYERILVWGLIGGMCFIAILEAASKMSYERALSRLQQQLDAHTNAEPFTVEAALASVNRPAKNISPEDSNLVVYEWRWPTLRPGTPYCIRIVASAKKRVVSDLQTGAAVSTEPVRKIP